MKATLTIFTPAYNRAYTLHKCYESLKKQTNKDFEWLIIDDGSTDNTRELVQSWIEENLIPIKYHYQKNQGMHGAHNSAYELIDTKLNVCIDSDDYIAPDMCEKMLILAEQNKADMVVCNITYTYLHKPNFTPNPILRKPYTQVSSEQALILAITEHSFGDTGMCNKLCKRSLLANFKFKENVRSEDFFALCVLFPKAKKIIYTPQSFYFYFQNPNGVTAQRNLKPRIDSYNAVKFFIEICQKYQYHKALKAIEYRYVDSALIAAFLIILCDLDNNYKEIEKELFSLIDHEYPRKRYHLSLIKQMLWYVLRFSHSPLKKILRISFINKNLRRFLRADK